MLFHHLFQSSTGTNMFYVLSEVFMLILSYLECHLLLRSCHNDTPTSVQVFLPSSRYCMLMTPMRPFVLISSTFYGRAYTSSVQICSVIITSGRSFVANQGLYFNARHSNHIFSMMPGSNLTLSPSILELLNSTLNLCSLLLSNRGEPHLEDSVLILDGVDQISDNLLLVYR